MRKNTSPGPNLRRPNSAGSSGCSHWAFEAGWVRRHWAYCALVAQEHRRPIWGVAGKARRRAGCSSRLVPARVKQRRGEAVLERLESGSGSATAGSGGRGDARRGSRGRLRARSCGGARDRGGGHRGAPARSWQRGRDLARLREGAALP